MYSRNVSNETCAIVNRSVGACAVRPRPDSMYAYTEVPASNRPPIAPRARLRVTRRGSILVSIGDSRTPSAATALRVSADTAAPVDLGIAGGPPCAVSPGPDGQGVSG